MLKNYYLSMALFLSMFILLFIIYITWRYRKIPITFKLSIMMLATFFYLSGYASKVAFNDLRGIKLCLHVEYLGFSFLPVLLLILIFDCTGFDYLKKSFYWILFIIPTITLIMQLTNDWHHLLYRSITLLKRNGYSLVYLVKGPWFWVHIIYSYCSIVVCVIILIKFMLENDLYRKEIILIGLGIDIPWFYNLFYLFNEKGMQLNLTPLACTIANFILVFTVYRMNLLKIAPIAFEKVVQFMSEAVIILDHQNQVIHYNGPAIDIIPELQDIKLYKDNMKDIFQKYPAIQDVLCSNLTAETRFRMNRNGMIGVYNLKLTFIYKKKCILGKILILSDISAMEKAREDLSVTSAQLSTLNILKDRLIQVVTSDIKAPLDMLQNLTELLRKSEINPVLKNDLINEIQKNINCIYLRVDNMLDYLQNRQLSNIYSPMNWKLSVLVNEALKSIAEKAANKNISIDIFIEEDMMVYADKGAIDIVLKNLLSNAVKFTKPNGCITLTAMRENDYIILSVKDTGIGMEPEKVQMLFQDVEAPPVPGTDGEVGIGLGLIICRQIIKRNYGDIWVDSTVGEGSDFFVSIPATNESNIK